MGRTRWLWLISLIFLTACATASEPPASKITDPTDEEMKSVIADYLLMSGAPRNSVYQYARYDLDKDGRRDALVLFSLPYHYWCNWGGCSMIVLKAGNDRFSSVSKIENVRAPVTISPLKSSGWHDLILRASGTDNYDKTVRLAFNGATYPPDALTSEFVPYNFGAVVGDRFFE